VKNTEEFWRGLTPEKAFLVRVFVDHCVSTKDNTSLEKVLPVVTTHAFRIQDAYNTLLDSLAAAEEAGGEDEVADDREFILAELLRLALNLDYADEIGRRRLEQFVRTWGFPISRCCSAAEQRGGRTYDISGSSTFRARNTLP
jgi:condensin complex subunit 3